MKRILFGIFICVFLVACKDTKNETKSSSDVTSSNGMKQPIELLDSTLVGPVKASFASFTKGDIDGFTADYDDNVRFIWSGGDSLVGRQAVKDYFAGRWKLIETLKFSNDIFLPIQANVSPNGQAQTGKWMLHWVQTDVKYKNGKSLSFWLHNASHYNDAGKIDYVAQYIDRHPLLEATKDMAK